MELGVKTAAKKALVPAPGAEVPPRWKQVPTHGSAAGQELATAGQTDVSSWISLSAAGQTPQKGN